MSNSINVTELENAIRAEMDRAMQNAFSNSSIDWSQFGRDIEGLL